MHRETFLKRRQLAAAPEMEPAAGASCVLKVTRLRRGRALAPCKERKSGVGNHEQASTVVSVEADGSIKRWLNASKIA
jgi:hypothetical protein